MLQLKQYITLNKSTNRTLSKQTCVSQEELHSLASSSSLFTALDTSYPLYVDAQSFMSSSSDVFYPASEPEDTAFPHSPLLSSAVDEDAGVCAISGCRSCPDIEIARNMPHSKTMTNILDLMDVEELEEDDIEERLNVGSMDMAKTHCSPLPYNRPAAHHCSAPELFAKDGAVEEEEDACWTVCYVVTLFSGSFLGFLLIPLCILISLFFSIYLTSSIAVVIYLYIPFDTYIQTEPPSYHTVSCTHTLTYTLCPSHTRTYTLGPSHTRTYTYVPHTYTLMVHNR